jgi:hypothetical protein
MTLPGFNAEASAYKTNVHYRSMGATVQADGVVPQQLSCGPCFLDNTGACVQDCTFTSCVPLGRFGRRCFTYTLTEPCSPSACQTSPPNCSFIKGEVCGGAIKPCDQCPFYPSDCTQDCPFNEPCGFPECCFSCAAGIPARHFAIQ